MWVVGSVDRVIKWVYITDLGQRPLNLKSNILSASG